MGAVFEAQDQGIGRRVALKVLAPELSDEETFRRRFVQEAATLVALDSPHVITLYDYGDVDGSLFIAMQLVDGRDLAQLLEDGGALDPEQALEIAAQVADALADAHGTGLVHRDVKPSNVLVRYIRGEPFVYLCDFGIAKSEQSPHTRTRGIIGTFEYMAPERHLGNDAGQSSDIYSLGCLLWAALSGHAPYQGTSEVQVAMAHVQQPIPDLDPTLPAHADLQAMMAKAMAKEPADRFQSASEMRSALRAAQGAVRRERLQPSARPAVTEQTALRSASSLARGATADPVNRRPAGLRWLVVVLAALALIAVAGAGYALVRPGQDDPDSKAGATTSARPIRSTAPATARPTRRTPRPVPRVSGSTATSAPAPTTAPDEVAPSPSATTPAELVCWDGAGVAAVSDCSTPTGPAGMASVFPSFEGCPGAPPREAGKVEAFLCSYDGFVIRYSRWADGADRVGYLDGANPGAVTGPWVLDGETSGTRWTSYESTDFDPKEDERYQWSATYANAPFEVSVEGVTEADREAGIARVRAKPSSQVGLR